MKEQVVKFMSRGLPKGADPGQFIRAFPGQEQKWGNCRFTLDVDATDYDWLVVYHDIPKDGRWLVEISLCCPKECTILITPEPSSITVYGTDYLKQFGTIITYQEPWVIKHPNVLYQYPGMIWYYGYSMGHGTYTTYDQLVAEEPEKTRKISTVCSSRTGQVTLHSKRLGFTERLQEDVPDLEVFGHGVRPMDDKAESLRPYEHHIVIENHVAPHHLTEKLPDAFLGYALPFYHGAPNAADYLPAESFIPIDIDDYETTRDIIRHHLGNNEYQDRLPYIREARRRVLEEMNIFAVIEKQVSDQAETLGHLSSGGVIRNRSTMRIKNPVAGFRSLWEKGYVKLRHRLLAARAGT
jgi:hypothetical protein